MRAAAFCFRFSLCVLGATFGQASGSGTSPNIVLILTDDQGWNGTSVQMDPNVPGSKSDFYQTPRLEELAAAGMRFSDGYSSAPVCSPTRAAIQTGMSTAQLNTIDLVQATPGSTRWEGLYAGLPLTPPAPRAFDVQHYTLPMIVKDADPAYQTALFGKWHLDVPDTTTPALMGFDHFEKNVFDSSAEGPNPDPWGVFQMSNAANLYMEQRVSNSQPFFMQLSYIAVHPPIYYRQSTKDKYDALPSGSTHGDPAYAAMTEDFDTAMGTVLDKIDELGIGDNTYVFFVSDNGSPIRYSRSTPLKSGKGTIHEGGIRVPFIVKGPEIQPGSVSNVPVVTTDIYSTVAAMAGHSGPLPENVEGANLLPLLENGGQLPAGVEHLERNFHDGGELYWHWAVNVGVGPNNRTRPASAVRDGNFKLYLQYGESGASDELYLYNLATDIGENVNLAQSMPEKVAELKSKLLNYLEAVDASFAFDIKDDVEVRWDASAPGSDPRYWRSTTNLKDNSQELLILGQETHRPEREDISPFQPGLPRTAFKFDGNDQMSRIFFQVGDDGPRQVTPNPGTPDWDRSATIECWVRFDSLASSQVLFESGDGTGGISATIGDADGDGKHNDLRFRVLGLTGPNGGEGGTLNSLTVTAQTDKFADPTRDFVHLTAVFNDDPTDRYAEIYVNGALAGRTTGLLGVDQSLQWDGYDDAGLGGASGDGLGAQGGTGPLPFEGGFRGELPIMHFYNHAISAEMVQTNYNLRLTPAGAGIRTTSGDTMIPNQRPTSVAIGESESSAVAILHERDDILDSAVLADTIVRGTTVLAGSGGAQSGVIPAGAQFSSYLVQFDPAGDFEANQSAVGSIDFTGRVMAILFDSATLAATDSIFGVIGDYGPESSRGFTPGIDGFLGVSNDRHTLSFGLTTPGTELVQFRVLTTAPGVADFNGDGLVTSLDLPVWESAFAVSDGGDADGDGDTDGEDFLIWQRQLVDLSADFDGTGIVDQVDLARWEASYGVDAQGDATGDGVTDGRDFLAWQRQFNGSLGDMAAARAVPEPTALLMFLSIMFAFGRRRCNRSISAPSQMCDR